MKSKSPQPAANKDSLDHVKDALQALAEFLTGIATTEKRDWALSIRIPPATHKGRRVLEPASSRTCHPAVYLKGVFSPFNWECEAPPKIFKDSVFVAYLTENENITPRVSPYSLIEFLYDEGKGAR